MSVLSSYPMSKGSGHCASTGQPIPPGSHCIAALVEVPVEAKTASQASSHAPSSSASTPSAGGVVLQRQDYSTLAWERGDRPLPPARLFGCWKTTYQPTVKPKSQLLDDDALLELFESTNGASEPKQVRFRYLLGLLLVRRRLLRVVATKPRGGERVLHVLRRGEPMTTPMELVDPGLDDAAIVEAMDMLSQVLDPDAQGSGSNGGNSQ